MPRPLCIDLFCGLGGWAEGFLSEGYDVVGFDIERHDYGTGGYPGQLVLQDVLTLHGSQFKDAACIVASPPCQKYSYMAMPWRRAKVEAAWQRWFRDSGSPFADRFALNDLFDACFRIQREASEAAGHDIPMVIENVQGAQAWAGRSRYIYGSFHLWGDVPALMPYGRPMKNETGGTWFGIDGSGKRTEPNCARDRIAQKQSVWFNDDKRKCGGDWFGSGKDCSLMRSMSSKSSARKAASAQIAKIPFPLSSWIAQCFKPAIERVA
jgi:C-5 cytosine-specific DNA methylase